MNQADTGSRTSSSPRRRPMILVTYDIVDDKMRAKVAKTMESHGRRVQKSVFECRLTEGEIVHLQRELYDLIDPEADSIRFYRQCQRCHAALELIGIGDRIDEEEVLIL